MGEATRKSKKASNMLKAIAHPVRIDIIRLLRDGKRMSVTEIFEHLNMKQATISQHLRILKDRDAVVCERDGKNRYYYLKHIRLIQVIYCIDSCCE